MKVTLVNYVGRGTADPARAAAAQLIFSKSTRLQMSPGLLEEIEGRPWSYMEEELRYMANTIPSSWEFIDYTFMIEGVSRAFTHQFVRSRQGSYAQQTMRVLDVSEGPGWDYVTGPSIANRPDGDKLLHSIYATCMDHIAEVYKSLIKHGAAIEDARGILPTNIQTNIVAKFNFRTLCELTRKRASSRTQGEYREVLEAMKREVLAVHPFASIFFDRSFDKAANELEAMIVGSIPPCPARTAMIKLIDQMRNA